MSQELREWKNNKLVDLSKNAKKYNTVEDGWTISNEAYTLGDGFVAKIRTASGAPQRTLYKNGKGFITDKLKDADVFLELTTSVDTEF